MTKYYCDKCKKEIEQNSLTEKEKFAECNTKVYMYNRDVNENLTGEYFELFLCKECFEDAMSYLEENCKKKTPAKRFKNKRALELGEKLQEAKFRHDDYLS